MNAWEPVAAAPHEDGGPATFAIGRPVGVPITALVFTSPHSGRVYPPSLMAASRLDAESIRHSEDAYVDKLIEAAPAFGIPVLAARVARAYLDVNREPWELDPQMFEDELPAYARARTPRVAAGLGSIARIVAEGREIYARKLTFAEACGRVDAVHRPYHAALAGLVAEARQAHGRAILVDWHSMPSAAAMQSGGAKGCDIVLGDRYGGACSPTVSRLAEQAFQALGYSVARNAPYAGGYTTQHYGRPARHVHALQVEVNRGLYLDETTLTRTPDFHRLEADFRIVFERLAAVDWPAIL